MYFLIHSSLVDSLKLHLILSHSVGVSSGGVLEILFA